MLWKLYWHVLAFELGTFFDLGITIHMSGWPLRPSTQASEAQVRAKPTATWFTATPDVLSVSVRTHVYV